MTRLEALLWSIALPGFGQLLNKKHIKGILFIVLEFLINMGANFNEGIRLSFLGETKQSLEVMNMQWLMFYPCLYFLQFGMLLKKQKTAHRDLHLFLLSPVLILLQ